MTTPPSLDAPLAAQWRWHLTHASRTYWLAQGVFALVYFASSLVLVSWVTAISSGRVPSGRVSPSSWSGGPLRGLWRGDHLPVGVSDSHPRRPGDGAAAAT